MAAQTDLFDVMVATYGSGWKGASVQVKNWVRPAEHAGMRDVVCLTVEATGPDEFDRYVDEVIAQLQALKKVGRRKLQRIAKQEAETIAKMRVKHRNAPK